MQPTLSLHVLAGAVALVAGAVALVAAKGARLHRQSGRVFVAAMLAMGLTGALVAVIIRTEASIFAGLLASYLVLTAFTTVRPVPKRVDQGAMLFGFAVAIGGIATGVTFLARGEMEPDGIPAMMPIMFGTVALLGAIGDARRLHAGTLRGVRRITRHLWRMCTGLLIATLSFFLGQADRIPEAARIPALLGILAVAPLFFMLYWFWRVRRKPEAYGHARAVREG